jgi:hypothetical protein
VGKHKVLDEIARTCDGLDAEMSEDGRYVRVSDGQCSWWQPADKLLPILQGMPDSQRRREKAAGGAEGAPDDEVGADCYADWCRETAPAGFFGHNASDDMMPVPADFRGELPS